MPSPTQLFKFHDRTPEAIMTSPSKQLKSIIKQCYQCLVNRPTTQNAYNAYAIPDGTLTTNPIQSIHPRCTPNITHHALPADNIYLSNHATKPSNVSRFFKSFTSGTDPGAYHTRGASIPSSYHEDLVHLAGLGDPGHLSSVHFAPRGLGNQGLLAEVVHGYHTRPLACSSDPAYL